MNREVRTAAWAAAGLLLSSLPAFAAPVGSDLFDYENGSIADRAGGTGWAAERFDEAGAPPSGPSDWNVAFGNANVVNGALVTQESGAIREFNGPSEGSTEPSNEREGAFRGAGNVFFGFDMTRQAGADWGGASSYDFGGERIFFGVPGSQTGQKFFGIDESGVDTSFTIVPVVEGVRYRLVAHARVPSGYVQSEVFDLIGAPGRQSLKLYVASISAELLGNDCWAAQSDKPFSPSR